MKVRRRISRPLEGVKIPARVPFPIDERLVARQIEAAKAHPIEHVKPLIKPRERA